MLDRVFSSETEFAKLIEEERKRIDGLKGVDLKKLLRGVAGFEVISRRYILASLVILGTVVKKRKDVIAQKLELSRSMFPCWWRCPSSATPESGAKFSHITPS